MSKKRIQVYADEEMKRRIELAAAKRNVPVTQYCLDAIEKQLAEDDVLERERIKIPVTPESDDELLDKIRDLRERILASRGGKLITEDIVEQVRDEREQELLNLH